MHNINTMKMEQRQQWDYDVGMVVVRWRGCVCTKFRWCWTCRACVVSWSGSTLTARMWNICRCRPHWKPTCDSSRAMAETTHPAGQSLGVCVMSVFVLKVCWTCLRRQCNVMARSLQSVGQLSLTSLCGTVKWVSACKLSINSKWRWWMRMVEASFWRTHSPSWLAWSEVWRPCGAESAFIKWTAWILVVTVIRDDSTMNIVLVIIIRDPKNND